DPGPRPRRGPGGRHPAPHAGRDHRRIRARPRRRPGRRPPAFRRPLHLQRGGRADAPPRHARDPLGRDPRRPRLRRLGRRPPPTPGAAQPVLRPPSAARASALPAGERLSDLAAHGATLVIHLGAQAIEEIAATLLPHYGPDCPVAVVARASWPDEVVLRARLA